jgi:hypothetical protein
LPSEFSNSNSTTVGTTVGSTVDPTVETATVDPFAIRFDLRGDQPSTDVNAEGISSSSAAADAAAADAAADDDVQAVLERAIAARKYAEHIAEGGSLDGSSTTATVTTDQRLQKQPLSVTRQSAAAQKGSLADPRQYFGGLDTTSTAGSRLGE